MQLSFMGLALSQTSRPAQGNYPASFNIKFIEAHTGSELTVNSPVAIDPSQLLVPVTWTFQGFSIAEIPYTDKAGKSLKFLKVSCTAITGVLQKEK